MWLKQETRGQPRSVNAHTMLDPLSVTKLGKFEGDKFHHEKNLATHPLYFYLYENLESCAPLGDVTSI